MNDFIVPIKFDDMFWKIHAELLQDDSQGAKHAGNSNIIELSWGWTAGMTDEELKEYAEDAPHGKESVRTTLDMAKELRDDLTRIIDATES